LHLAFVVFPPNLRQSSVKKACAADTLAA